MEKNKMEQHAGFGDHKNPAVNLLQAVLMGAFFMSVGLLILKRL